MSDIASILLPLNGTATGSAAMSLGLMLARRFSAHLGALHVGTDSREVAPLAGEGLSGAMVEEMMTAAERDATRRSREVRALFDAAIARDYAQFAASAGAIEPVERPPHVAADARRPTASFRVVTGREHEVVAHHARLSDLIVVPHPDSGDEVSSSEALHAVLFDSGRPVIIAPKQAPAEIGRRICLAWNGTAESASAVYMVMPWLHQAEAVHVLYSDDYQRRGPEVAELVDYLGVHGIAATASAFAPVEREVGAGLLAGAASFGADLLAMGAYSHSRLRQLILGGVTRHVLEKAQLPVLMSR